MTLLRSAAAAAGVFALMQTPGAADLLSAITRTLVVALLGAVGVPASDGAGELIVAGLHVPWTRDCAGLDTVAILFAVTIWTNRHQGFAPAVLGRLAAVVPAAVAANVGRVLTLVAYRSLAFPAVETPPQHYFLGLLWLLPVVSLFTPRRMGDGGRGRVEVIYLAAVLALLAPIASAPGGTITTVATLLVVAQSRLRPVSGGAGSAAALAWMMAGVFTAAGRMESLWLPWLLCCPWFVSPALARSPTGIVVLAGTIPPVVTNAVGSSAVAAALGWQLVRLVRASAGTVVPADHPVLPGLPTPARAGLALVIVFPFLASSAASRVPAGGPAPGIMARALDAGSYRVRVAAQPRDLYMDWFESFGDGRHHTLPVCMRYRGIHVRETAEAGVFSDGTTWMREFFLVGDELVLDYPSYLRRTIVPFSPPGVHLIASSPTDRMSADAFASAAEALARDIHRVEIEAARTRQTR